MSLFFCRFKNLYIWEPPASRALRIYIHYLTGKDPRFYYKVKRGHVKLKNILTNEPVIYIIYLRKYIT